MAITTLPELFLDSVRNRPRDDCFQRYDRTLGFVPVSSGEARDRIHRLARGLRALGIAKGDRVAILAENRLEWALADLAIICNGAVSVPMHSILLADTVDYGALTDLVASTLENEQYTLLERMAERVAELVLADERVTEVGVRATKLRPPVPHHLTSSGVSIRRRPPS